ncbi:hypothetical protein [Pseudomonas gregormendelii]
MPEFQPSTQRLVCGWGINDADYGIQISSSSWNDGIKEFTVEYDCPYYKKWSLMLTRCFSQKFKIKNPTYADVTVCDEWKRFSVFRAWMETMPWQGNELDKDILGDGTHYSPRTCCFVPKSVNMFWTRCGKKDVGLVGVSFDKSTGNFKAQCKIGGRRRTLGRFTSESDAHKAWIRGKAESLRILLGSLSLDERIVEGMHKKLQSFEIQAAA